MRQYELSLMCREDELSQAVERMEQQRRHEQKRLLLQEEEEDLEQKVREEYIARRSVETQKRKQAEEIEQKPRVSKCERPTFSIYANERPSYNEPEETIDLDFQPSPV